MTSLIRTSVTAGIATLAVLATASASLARPDARNMTCHQTQALIDQHGAITISTGQYTYERFVAYDGYCYHPEERHITYIRTKDAEQCPVYHCVEPMRPLEN